MTDVGDALRDAADAIEDAGDTIHSEYRHLENAELASEICWNQATITRQLALFIDANYGNDRQ